MMSIVSVNTNLFQRGESKVHAFCTFSRQVYNWHLPHGNSSLNTWGLALWQHTNFTVVTDRTLWSKECSRSAVFLEIHLCENKKKRNLVGILSICANVFVWATRRRAMERSWHLHRVYPIVAADIAYHIFDKYLNWQCLINNRISRHVWLKTYLRCSHKLPNPKLIFKNGRVETYLMHKCTIFSASRLFRRSL